jgi:hypothetical protein
MGQEIVGFLPRFMLSAHHGDKYASIQGADMTLSIGLKAEVSLRID